MDDILCVLKPIRKGWFFNRRTNRRTFDTTRTKTDNTSNDERTSNVISDIANSLEDNIQFTIVYP